MNGACKLKWHVRIHFRARCRRASHPSSNGTFRRNAASGQHDDLALQQMFGEQHDS